MSVGSDSIGPNYIAPVPTGSRDWDFANPESRDWKIHSGIAIPGWRMEMLWRQGAQKIGLCNCKLKSALKFTVWWQCTPVPDRRRTDEHHSNSATTTHIPQRLATDCDSVPFVLPANALILLSPIVLELVCRLFEVKRHVSMISTQPLAVEHRVHCALQPLTVSTSLPPTLSAAPYKPLDLNLKLFSDIHG